MQVDEDQCLSDLLYKIVKQKIFAVSVNGKFVPKSNYINININPNDKIDIVIPMQGG